MRCKQTKHRLLEGRESKSILKKDKRAAMSVTAAGRGKGSGPCYHQLIKQEVRACIHHHICHGNQMYYSNVRENKTPRQAWQGAATDFGSPQGARCTKAEEPAGFCSWMSDPWGGFLKLRWENGAGQGWGDTLKTKYVPPPQGLLFWPAKVRGIAGKAGHGHQLVEDRMATN